MLYITLLENLGKNIGFFHQEIGRIMETYFSRLPFICTRPCTTDGCNGVQSLRRTNDIFGRSTGNVWVCMLCKKSHEEKCENPK